MSFVKKYMFSTISFCSKLKQYIFFLGEFKVKPYG